MRLVDSQDQRYFVILLLFFREDEGIELQVLNRDKNNDCQSNEGAFPYEPVDFADFNASSVKDDVPTSKSGTIGT